MHRVRIKPVASLLSSTLLLGAAVAFAQTSTTARATHRPAAHHAAAAAHPAAACPAALPAPVVPAGLPPAPGVLQTAYAMRYVDTQVGTGDEAVPGSMVALHYTGWLASDGSKFDSSYDHPDKEPIRLPLGGGRVIPGWDTGIVGMKQGGKRRLFIPYQLAYGFRGRPPVIPAKADLIFDVELVEVTGNGATPSASAPAPPQ